MLLKAKEWPSEPQYSSGTTSLGRDPAGSPLGAQVPGLCLRSRAHSLMHAAWPRQQEQLCFLQVRAFFSAVYCPSCSVEASPKRKHLSKVLSATLDADLDALLI